MSDYISKAQAVAQTIAEIESLDIIEVCKALEQKIKNDYISQPSADVVEVVRCKDCKRGGWRVSGLDNKTKGYRCAIHAVLGVDFGDNGYCSYGERKEK